MDNVVDEDADGDDMDLGDDLSGYDHDELFFGFEQNDDIGLSNEELDAFFDNVHDVAKSTTETDGVSNVLKLMPPTFDQIADTSANMDTTSRIPPLPVATPTSLPSECDLFMTQDPQPPL